MRAACMMDPEVREEFREVQRMLTRVDNQVREHDQKVASHVATIMRTGEQTEESAKEMARAVDRMATHLERVEELLAKLTNGTANKMIWILVSAVVVAALGNKALDVLLAQIGGGK